MLESAIAFIPDAFAYWTQTGTSYGPLSRVASSQCFAWVCADGLAISIHLSVPDKFWSSLLDALEAHGSLGKDPRFKSRKERVGNYVEPRRGARENRQHQAAGSIGRRSLPNTTCHLRRSMHIPQVLDDPQVRHLGTFETAQHPTKGEIVGIRNPIRINGVRAPVVAPPSSRRTGPASLHH